MSQSGMSVDQLQTGLKTMVNAVDQAVTGTGKGAESFDKLGVSVLDASGNVKDQETIFNESVIALQGMEDGTEKAKLANDLFGRSGSEMMPLLNGAAGSVEEMKKQAHDLGLVLNDEAIDAGVKFTDSMDQVKRMLGAVGTQIGVEVMPIMQSMLEWIVAHMPQIKEVMSAVFGAISAVVKTAVDIFKIYLLPVFQFLYDWVQANMPMIKETTGLAFAGINEVWETLLKPAFDAIMSVLGLVWELFKAVWPSVMTVVGVAFSYIQQIWTTILQPTFLFIFDIIQQLVAKFQEHMPVIENTFKVMADTIKWAYDTVIKPAIDLIAIAIGWMRDKFTEYIMPLVGRIIDWFSTIATTMQNKIEFARDRVSAAINAIKGFFDSVASARDTVLGIFDGIKDGIKEKIEWARDKVSGAIEAMKGFFNFEWKLPHIKMPSFSVSGSANPLNWLKEGVPKLSVNWNAMGGIFDKPTIFNTSAGLQGVGEAGPEAIMPLSKLESMLNLNNQGREVNVNVNIEHFNNNNNDDINKLAEKLAFETNRRLAGGGLGFA